MHSVRKELKPYFVLNTLPAVNGEVVGTAVSRKVVRYLSVTATYEESMNMCIHDFPFLRADTT